MAIDVADVAALKDAGVFASGPLRILDIGRQRLRCARAADLVDLAADLRGKAPSKTLQRKLERCGQRAAEDGANEPATLGELLKMLSHSYQALDSVPGPDTTVFDVALDPLPEELIAGFDLVICGTAGAICDEPGHLLHTAHDAAKAGGWLLYRVPVQVAAGTATAADADLIIRTAEANGYQLGAAWLDTGDDAPSRIERADAGSEKPSLQHLRTWLAEHAGDDAAPACLLLHKTGGAAFAAPRPPETDAFPEAEQIGSPAPAEPSAAGTDLYRYIDGKTQTILTYVEQKNHQTLDHLDSRIEQVLAALRERPDHAYLESKTTQTLEYVDGKTQQILAALDEQVLAALRERPDHAYLESKTTQTMEYVESKTQQMLAALEQNAEALQRIDEDMSQLSDELRLVRDEARRGPVKFLWRRLARLVGR